MSSDVNNLLGSFRRYTTRLRQELESYVLNDEIEGPREIEKSQIIAINDAARVNAKNVVVDINPKQNLHGYDHPWVGGAGKNIWDEETIQGFYFVNDGQKNDDINQLCSKNSIPVNPSTCYYTNISNNAILFYDNNYQYISYDWMNHGHEFTTPSNCYYIHFNLGTEYGTTYNNDIFISNSQNSHTYSPYANICPISGWNEVNVKRCGKNLWNGKVISNNYFQNAFALPSSLLDFTISLKNASGKQINAVVFNSSGTTIVGDFALATASQTSVSKHLTVSEQPYLLIYGTSGTDVTKVTEVQVEAGSTATTYEPYQGVTHTIQLGDTIYGGELDVTKGELRVKKGIVTIQNFGFSNDATTSGGLKWQEAELTSALSGSSHSIANLFAYDSSGWWSSIPCYYVRNERVRICTDVHSQAELSEKYADLQIIYDLVTPYTIQLTPKQIKLLENNNTIYADSGDISIEYQPNNTIGKVIATIEDEYDPKPEVVDQYTNVFGFVEDMDVLSTSGRITYIGTNENYTPITVDLSTGHYMLNDWADFPFLTENKPYMVRPDGTPDYQLNEYDYTRKLDGSASDVANESYNGGAFSFAKKIYSKTWMEGNKRYVLFSFTKKEGFEARGFINPDGSEVDGRWIPMFYGTIVNGVAKSIATGNCITGANITTDAQHDAIVAFDNDAMFFGGSFVEVLNDLMIMFAKNTNSQASYGYGNSSGYNSSLANNGMLDNAVVGGGQFYGTSDAHSLNKIFHSIVLGTYNSWMRDPYEVVRYGEVMVSKDYTYDPTGNTYDDSGVSSPNQSAGWKYPVRYIDVPGYGALPDVASLSTSTSLARADGDYVPSNQSSLVVVCLRFGACHFGVPDGSSARSWYTPAADTIWDVGFALLLSKSAAA